MSRLLRRPAAPAAGPLRLVLAPVCAAALVACSAGTAESVPGSSATAGSTASPTPTAAAGPTPSAAPQAQVIEVTYAAGELTGVEPRVDVALGEQVVLRVTSDVAEEIHVHGYDRYVDVPAGGTGEVAFVADIPGAFEVELHDAGRPMFQLRVA